MPSYGSAPHQQGGSSLLVAGLGRRFIELFDARARNVDLIGALSADMAEDYLSQRAFDAVIIEAGIEDSLDLVERIRRDARFSQIPVLAFAEDRAEVAALFEMGANDVLHGDLTRAMLSARLASAIRMGKRRRLADRLLAESRVWLLRQAGEDGLPLPSIRHTFAAVPIRQPCAVCSSTKSAFTPEKMRPVFRSPSSRATFPARSSPSPTPRAGKKI
ncbi:hypothetical protein V6L77_23735 [Pannonibacter sp. Pt2-lr]